MPPHVVCVAVQQHGVLLEVGLQLSPDQVVALLLLELHCTQQPPFIRPRPECWKGCLPVVCCEACSAQMNLNGGAAPSLVTRWMSCSWLATAASEGLAGSRWRRLPPSGSRPQCWRGRC